MKIVPIIFNFLVVLILTILTQVGGIVWLLNSLAHKLLKHKLNFRYKFLSFLTLYSFCTFLVVPLLAPSLGRTSLPMTKNGTLAPHTYFTVLLNRQYVTPKLKNELIQISDEMESNYPGIKTIYLDANFPFWNGFPLLPHLSHSDGKKVDLAFNYSREGKTTNQKPSRSGYGHYENPQKGESDQPSICAGRGHWQYNFPQYLTFGSSGELQFDDKKTKQLIKLILTRKATHKVFLEPHLKERMKMHHNKLRFHGCQSVRHDDHIHYQIK